MYQSASYIFEVFNLLTLEFYCSTAAIENAFDLVNIETTKFYTLSFTTPDEKKILMQKVNEITLEYTEKAKVESSSASPDFDKRGGHSINLKGRLNRHKYDFQAKPLTL